MAGRNWRGTKVSQVVPIWTTANADMNTAIFISFMHRLGINGTTSYLRRLAIPAVGLARPDWKAGRHVDSRSSWMAHITIH